MSSGISFNLDQSKILLSGNGLRNVFQQEGHDGPVSLADM